MHLQYGSSLLNADGSSYVDSEEMLLAMMKASVFAPGGGSVQDKNYKHHFEVCFRYVGLRLC